VLLAQTAWQPSLQFRGGSARPPGWPQSAHIHRAPAEGYGSLPRLGVRSRLLGGPAGVCVWGDAVCTATGPERAHEPGCNCGPGPTGGCGASALLSESDFDHPQLRVEVCKPMPGPIFRSDAGVAHKRIR